MSQSSPEMVTVYVSAGQLGAEVVRGKLETAGIPAYLQYESVGLVLGLTVDGLGRVEVMTPAQFAEAAAALLAESSEADDLDGSEFEEDADADADGYPGV